MSYPVHPDAALFPLMNDTELAELVADIGKNGLLNPLMLDPTGTMLVDGRNRERACETAGAELRYERLPEGTDIFTYIVSTNLYRRHLSPSQKAAIIIRVIARNPEKSNRQIAKIAKVSHSTINEIRSTGKLLPVESKTVGADGKSRPSRGKISSETKAAIIASLEDDPYGQKAIAEKHGVSVGTVAGIKRKMREAKGLYPKAAPKPSMAEMAERRKHTVPVPFDSLSREERGMGSKEYGAEPAPGYPEGWTRDDAFRVENGRIQLYTPAQRAVQETVRQCNNITGLLAQLARSVDVMPEADQLAEMSAKQRDDIFVLWRKYAPQVGAGLERLLLLAAQGEERNAPGTFVKTDLTKSDKLGPL